MAQKNEPWFRFYVETVHDRKLRRLPAEHRWVWVALLAATKRSPIRGCLMLSETEPFDVNDLADFAAVPVDAAQAALDAFAAVGMIEWDPDFDTWFVRKWHERQFDSDSSTERVRKHRQKKAREETPEDGTSMKRSTNVSVTPPDTDTDPESPSVTSADADVTGFVDFWERYPKRDGKRLGKKQAMAVWKRMSNTKRTLALAAVDNYRESGQRAKDAHRWLNHELWDEWDTPATPDQQGVVTPIKQTVC